MATNAVLDMSRSTRSLLRAERTDHHGAGGAPLADVQSLIDSKNQQFAFEPMDTSALLGVSGNGTIGGMIGAGLAGPRRIKAGGAATICWARMRCPASATVSRPGAGW
jgi:glycolate oxidase FAD binding subunit